MSPRYKDVEWEDESYTVIDYLIDNDPIELGRQLARCERDPYATRERVVELEALLATADRCIETLGLSRGESSQ